MNYADGIGGAVAELEGADGRRVVLLPRHLVGRSASCDLVLHDPSVSGEHAVLTWNGEHWSVRDLSSSNGTRLQGRPVTAGKVLTLVVGDRLQCGSSEVAWVLVDDSAPTRAGLPATVATGLDFDKAELRFEVSSDEEHVAWSVVVDSIVHDLGSRAHTYTILTLARARLSDAERSTEARGWRVADDLAKGLGISPEVLKVYVYRARKQLETAGLRDASEVVQRRPTSNQIRLGTDHVVIRRV